MKQFDAPIPGQSLTNEPKNHPWERPPETSNPDEAVVHHLTRLGQPKVLNSILDAVGQGIPVSMLTDLLLTGAVAQGIHSIDISMMVAPVIQDYIVNLLEEEGVEFKEFFEEDNDDDVLQSIALSGAISGLRESSKSKGKDDTESAMKAEPKVKPDEIEEPMEDKPKRGGGLMSRKEV
jgi:hypothetical protein